MFRTVARLPTRPMAAAKRTQAIARHMSSAAATTPPTQTPAQSTDEPLIVFKSEGTVRQYILNRPAKYNALNEPMLNILRPFVEESASSELGKIIVGSGVGKAFCAGGDVVSVIEAAANDETRQSAIEFFRREFELDYLLAALPKPYVAVMDGVTMGGGVGLVSHAPFRIATEKTIFAMPETKIGYAPDVGASHFLSRTDGEIGTYLALTGESLFGRQVFEHGFATHFVPSRRIPALLQNLAALEDPTPAQIDSLLEESYSEREPNEPPSPFVGKLRIALDSAFRGTSVVQIVKNLHALQKDHKDADVRTWAQKTIAKLEAVSPTSLLVALTAIRRGKELTLLEALQMEMNFATAYCSNASLDFRTGVTAVLVEKSKTRPSKTRPDWSPSTIAELNEPETIDKFFAQYTPANKTAPELVIPQEFMSRNSTLRHPMQFALPTEQEIEQMIVGTHGQSGATSVTLPELITRFNELRRGKSGVREKIVEVVDRKCEEVGDKMTGEKWLKWKH